MCQFSSFDLCSLADALQDHINVVLGVLIVGPGGILVSVQQCCHANKTAGNQSPLWARRQKPKKLPPLPHCGDEHLTFNRHLGCAYSKENSRQANEILTQA